MNGVTILFVYAVIMILATVILTKKEKNVERFCVGSRSENCLMSALSIAAPEDYKYIYEGLISGDPKTRTLRALYQKIYGSYISRTKKEKKHG